MRSFTISVLQAASLLGLVSAGDTSDGKRTFQEICAENGFAFEQHQVITEDGYILAVYRIPGKAGQAPPEVAKPPVYLQHGLLDSANAWIMNYPDVAPAFVLANEGYDVWLNNTRGNTYSRAHVSLNPNHKAFWEFDWQQMGQYDVNGVLDYIIMETGYDKVAYIGHSQGTTQMFYALATFQEEMIDKVAVYVALGPVTQITKCGSPFFQNIADDYETYLNLWTFFDQWEFMPDNWMNSTQAHYECGIVPWYCMWLETFFINTDPLADDPDRFTVYMDHQPNGSPTRSVLHYAQQMREARFQVWDPDYNQFALDKSKNITDLIPLENIRTPTAMFVAESDILADSIDAEWTRDTIGEAVFHY